jgi:hypothetical protein
VEASVPARMPDAVGEGVASNCTGTNAALARVVLVFGAARPHYDYALILEGEVVAVLDTQEATL